MGTPEHRSLGQRAGVEGGTAQRCGGAYAFSYWEQRRVCAVSHLLKYRCAGVEQTANCVVSLLQAVVCSVWTSAPESASLEGWELGC